MPEAVVLEILLKLAGNDHWQRSGTAVTGCYRECPLLHWFYDDPREMKSLKFDVFGRDILIREKAGGWEVFYLGDDGKRRLARDIFVPSNITESEMARYLDDLCHEWATERNPDVRQLD